MNALDEIAAIKARETQAKNDLALIVVGVGQLNNKVALLQSVIAANPIPAEVQAALDDLLVSATELQGQADAAALPFAPPH